MLRNTNILLNEEMKTAIVRWQERLNKHGQHFITAQYETSPITLKHFSPRQNVKIQISIVCVATL